MHRAIPLTYMATPEQPTGVQNRGLLTEDDRAFFAGEKETDDPAKTEREKRYNIRQRIENVATDIELLREHGHDELVEDFYDEVGRYERLERELRRLREEREGDGGKNG